MEVEPKGCLNIPDDHLRLLIHLHNPQVLINYDGDKVHISCPTHLQLDASPCQLLEEYHIIQAGHEGLSRLEDQDGIRESVDIDGSDVKQITNIIELHIECVRDCVVVELEIFVLQDLALVEVLEFVLFDGCGG